VLGVFHLTAEGDISSKQSATSSSS
jgi:hypothetical protein